MCITDKNLEAEMELFSSSQDGPLPGPKMVPLSKEEPLWMHPKPKEKNGPDFQKGTLSPKNIL